MNGPSPLSTPVAWNMVSGGYAEELLPLFREYAADALERGNLTADSRVLDVATGPGTLALMAADRVKEVAAIDFAESMLAIARERAANLGVRNVTFRQADGQALPFEDGQFDAGFSMFGLMFFPDRAAGFRELHRVLRDGGRVVVSSWTPVDESPLLAALFGAMQEAMPELPFGKGGAGPLSNPDDFAAEMETAGFQDLMVERVIHRRDVPSLRHFWEAHKRGSAPVALIRSRMSEEEWVEFSDRVLERLEQRLGSEPVDFGWTAYLASGTKRNLQVG